MKKRIFSFFYQLSIILALILAISWVIDWLRTPNYPNNFIDQQYTTMSGETRSFAEISHDQPLLVYAWATWCNICRMTTPSVAQLAENGHNVISVAIRSGENQTIDLYLAKKDLQLAVINDVTGRLSSSWDIGVTPTFIIIYQGRVMFSATGWTSLWGLELRLWLASMLAD